MNLNLKLFSFASGLFLAVSCVEHDFPVTSYQCNAKEIVSYASEVDPIIKSNCAISGCHNGDMGSDLNWNDFSNLSSNAADVRDRITRPEGTPGHMPAVGSITRDQIQTIICWIEQGAANN